MIFAYYRCTVCVYVSVMCLERSKKMFIGDQTVQETELRRSVGQKIFQSRLNRLDKLCGFK